MLPFCATKSEGQGAMSRDKKPSDAYRKVDPFYLTAEWRKVRARVLKRDGICVECHVVPSSHCDHIKPRRLFPELELDETNLRGLCVSCHNTRSAQQYSPNAMGWDENGEPLDPTHPWHAGESARVVMRGRDRAPAGWQQPALREAMGRAPSEEPAETDAPFFFVPKEP
jgi:hypothetical protein